MFVCSFIRLKAEALFFLLICSIFSYSYNRLFSGYESCMKMIKKYCHWLAIVYFYSVGERDKN